jgi:hypothetical protein
MATMKSMPENTSADKQEKHPSADNTVRGSNTTKQPGNSATTDATRNAGVSKNDRNGANTNGTGSTAATSKDRSDRGMGSSHTTGQDPTGAREANDGELRDEDEEDSEPLPGAEDAVSDSGTDQDASASPKK